MTASSATGTGLGDCGKLTGKDFATLANAPSLLITGLVDSSGGEESPPPEGSNSVVFPYPLIGTAENYVIMLTTLSGGFAYVSDVNENDDGNFTGFTFITEVECTLMYMVAKVGIRPV